jgi:putative addiction module killer protein/probable addiction module antidote protein
MTAAYRDWINSLRDLAGRARVQVRVDRLAHGNPGQHRVLTDGVRELKIDFGPGYRVYYTERGGVLIILLAGGDKSSQAKDIRTAVRLAKNLSELVMRKSKTTRVSKTKTLAYDVVGQLRTPEEMAAYLDAWFEEAPDDAAGIARALGDIARARGMTQVARDAGLSRESLYKALSKDGNPSFATILKVARAVGVRLHALAD